MLTAHSKFNLYNDLNRKEFIIAHARTCIAQDDPDKAIELVNNYGWSSANNRMKAFVYAILNETDEVIKLLPIIKLDNSITVAEFESSNAFEKLRSDQKFTNKFAEIYERALNRNEAALIVSDATDEQSEDKIARESTEANQL